jgi:hypothetical protein
LQGLCQPKRAKTLQVSHKTAKIANAVYALVFVQSIWFSARAGDYVGDRVDVYCCVECGYVELYRGGDACK